MNDIQVLFEHLNGLEASIARAVRSVEGQPLSPSAKLTISSLERRRDELKEVLEALAAERLVDICDYRVLPNELHRYPVKAIGKSLTRWQDVVTAFFASVRDKKARTKAQYSDETEAAATLNFGYAYQGSLGLVMYVPNEQLMLTETDLDIAVDAIMRLSESENVGQVQRIAKAFGKAAVKSFFDWSKAHTDAGFSADIKWQRGDEIKFERVMQPADLERVQSIIKTADTREDHTDVYDGVLVALDVKQGAFKMSFPDPDLSDIRGKFDEHFDWKKKHHVPARYDALLRRIVYTSLWSNEERIEWELIELNEKPDLI
jgi:hypothetical protein